MTIAPTSHQHVSTGSVMLLLGSCTSLQFGAAVAAQLFDDLGSWGVTALRLGFAAVVLVAIARPSVREWTRRQWIAVGLFGLALGGMNGFFYAAIARIPLGTAVAIEFLGPLVLAAVLSRSRADTACVGLAAIGMALLGVESLSGDNPLDPVGVGFVLLAATSWAAYILTSARVGQQVPGTGGLAMAMVIGAVIVAPAGASGVATAITDPRMLGLAALTALLASLIPYTLEFAALRRMPRHVFGVLLSLEPVVAALAGLLILHQRLGLWQAVAIGLVVAASIGVALANRPRSQSRPRARLDADADVETDAQSCRENSDARATCSAVTDTPV